MSAQANGPPYLPTTALVGGVPTIPIDDPISAVLAALFLVSTALHMATFQVNKKHGHLFVFSAMMFAFSLIRGVALILRIVWASFPMNTRMAIAANILTQAGTVIVFIVNLFFAQRILRGYHPKLGWSTPARVALRFLVACVIVCLLMVIAVTIQSFYTLDVATRDADHKAQLVAGTYLAVLAFLPIPIVILAAITPRKHHVEKFGTGSLKVKLALVIFTSVLLSLGAGFRVGTNYNPRPLNDPTWYHTRAAYYIFNFVLDLIVSYTYLAAGFHKRFHIPNGAKGPGSYMATTTDKEHPYGSWERGEALYGADALAPPPTSWSFRSATSLKKAKLATNRASDATLCNNDLGIFTLPSPIHSTNSSRTSLRTLNRQHKRSKLSESTLHDSDWGLFAAADNPVPPTTARSRYSLPASEISLSLASPLAALRPMADTRFPDFSALAPYDGEATDLWLERLGTPPTSWPLRSNGTITGTKSVRGNRRDSHETLHSTAGGPTMASEGGRASQRGSGASGKWGRFEFKD
ncbi:hypothetical protein BJ170DRAFT_592198 [Xylariales sp. AK1849]|nr:hypothetical protein BJ170DRAFT_592198 [Xylariales sp. AK1849]